MDKIVSGKQGCASRYIDIGSMDTSVMELSSRSLCSNRDRWTVKSPVGKDLNLWNKPSSPVWHIVHIKEGPRQLFGPASLVLLRRIVLALFRDLFRFLEPLLQDFLHLVDRLLDQVFGLLAVLG